MVNGANGYCMQKKLFYMLPEDVVIRSSCMSWAIKEEIVQSMSSSSLDPQDLWVLSTFLKSRGDDTICSRLLVIKYKYLK